MCSFCKGKFNTIEVVEGKGYGVAGADPVVNQVQAMMRSRSEKGIQKYGVMLDRDDLTVEAWLNHLQEELLDASLYIQALKRNL